MNDQLIKAIHKRYVSKGLATSNPKEDPVDLRTKCEHGPRCWEAFEGLPQVSYVTQPWIGEQYYQRTKTLVLGINMNDHYGWDEYDNLIHLAKQELMQGKYKHFISSTYAGTLLYYRIAFVGMVVARIFDHAIGEGITAKAEDVVSGFDWIAYTNQIKCSPPKNRSEPSKAMWEYCGRHVLRFELEILRPKYVIVIGTSFNYNRFCTRLLDQDSVTWRENYGKVKRSEGRINSEPVGILGIPHPSSRIGNSDDLWQNEVLKALCTVIVPGV